MKNRKQNGVTLLELILVLGLLGIILIVLIKYIHEKAKEQKLRNTAHQMEKVIDDATTFVGEQFSLMYDDIIVNGSLTLTLEDIHNISSSDVLDYTEESPFSDNYHAVVRIPYDISGSSVLPEEKSLQIILYAINEDKTLNWLDARKFARIVKNVQGGVVYGINSILTPCLSSATFCISNPYGVWQIEDTGAGGISNVDISAAIDTILISGDLSLAPAVVTISNITESQALSAYVSRDSHPDNREQNTITTDINIDNSPENASSIFFNGMPDTSLPNPDPNGLLGASLTFYDDIRTCPDTNLACDEDEKLLFQNSALKLESNRIFNIEDGAGNPETQDDNPVFRSEGGLKTNLKAEEGKDCDVALLKNVIAVDETTGELLRCYENENYVYNDPDADSQLGIFGGDWKKIDWKKSFYFFNNNLSILSGLGAESAQTNSSFVNLVGVDVSDEAKFLLSQVSVEGSGVMNITVGGRTYLAIKTNYQQNIINPNRQIIIPVPVNKNINTWMSIQTIGAGISNWSFEIIGYIK